LSRRRTPFRQGQRSFGLRSPGAPGPRALVRAAQLGRRWGLPPPGRRASRRRRHDRKGGGGRAGRSGCWCCPREARDSRPSPLLPMTMRSASTSSATASRTDAALPSRSTWRVRTSASSGRGAPGRLEQVANLFAVGEARDRVARAQRLEKAGACTATTSASTRRAVPAAHSTAARLLSEPSTPTTIRSTLIAVGAPGPGWLAPSRGLGGRAGSWRPRGARRSGRAGFRSLQRRRPGPTTGSAGFAP
jgi:hypothetical protein